MKIRFGASNCDATINGETVSLSSCFGFKSVGGIHGLIRPTKNNDRASSALIAFMQRRGDFEKEKSESEDTKNV